MQYLYNIMGVSWHLHKATVAGTDMFEASASIFIAERYINNSVLVVAGDQCPEDTQRRHSDD